MHEVTWRAVLFSGSVRLHLNIDGDVLALCGVPSLVQADTCTLLGPATEKCTECVAIATAAAAVAREVPTHA